MLTWPTASRAPYLQGNDRPIAYSLSGSPAVRTQPVTLEQVKMALKISDEAEDAVLEAWIASACSFFEYTTERQLMTAEWEYTIEGTPADRRIEIPRPPLTHVLSVAFEDDAGVTQTVDPDTYHVTLSALPDRGSPVALLPIDPYCRPGAIELNTGTWPATRTLRIRRLCGYGATPADIPPLVQSVLFFLVGHFYKYRETTTAELVRTIPFGADMLMSGFKYSATARRIRATWPLLI